MIVVNTDNLKFIAFICPKTGSWSLRDLLMKYFNFKIIDIRYYNGQNGAYEIFIPNVTYETYHVSPVIGLKLLQPIIDISKFYTFGFVRDNYDRFISIYKFKKIINNHEFITIDHFFNIWNRLFYEKDNFFNLDKYYIDNDKIVVNELFDFHDYSNEIKRLFKRFHIQLNDIDIPWIHKTPTDKILFHHSLIHKTYIYHIFKAFKQQNILYTSSFNHLISQYEQSTIYNSI
jgi:hypothetical protein